MPDDGLVYKPPATPKKKATASSPEPVIAGTGAGVKTTTNPLAGFIRNPVNPVTEDEFNAATPQAKKPAGANTDLVELAKKYVGTPYKWGQSSPLGFDCSGFTQYVFKQFGINLPRVSNQQGRGGTAVKSMAEAQAGDLIFWDNSPRNNGADHVGIYLGNGMLISAPKPGDRVKIQAVYGNPFFRRYR